MSCFATGLLRTPVVSRICSHVGQQLVPASSVYMGSRALSVGPGHMLRHSQSPLAVIVTPRSQSTGITPLCAMRHLHVNSKHTMRGAVGSSRHATAFGVIASRARPLDSKQGPQTSSTEVVSLSSSSVRQLCTKPIPVMEPDSLKRYPDWTTGGLLRAGDYFGTAIFAMTGTLTAAATGMDLLGCVIVGTITAVGGGTIRDWILGHENGNPKRAFWLDEQEYIWISVCSAILTFFLWNELAEVHALSEDDFWIFLGDSIGIGVFCCIGAMNGARAGLNVPVAAICGMMTATFGGMTRDVLCRRPVRILHSNVEIYATTAYAGAFVYMLVRATGGGLAFRAVAGFSTAFGLRVAAWVHDLRLPKKERVYHHKNSVAEKSMFK